jgi:PmbA protein
VNDKELVEHAERTLAYARRCGADQVALQVSRSRFVEVKRRAGKIEGLSASTSRGLSLTLYVDGRYSSNATSFLEPRALETFVDESLAMTRMLAPDPFRSLPDPALYGPTPGVELDLYDLAAYEGLSMDQRVRLAQEAEICASEVDPRVISVTTEMTSQESQSLRRHSDGFQGQHDATAFYVSASVTVEDKGQGRKPEDTYWAGTAHLCDLPQAGPIGEEAARRAIDRIGSRKVDSAKLTLVVENRAASRLVSSLLAPLSGGSLQQHRSCFEGKLGQKTGSDLLGLHNDPLIPRSLGSRTFDGDGLKAAPLTIFDRGRLQAYLIDVYYGRKLDRSPTTGTLSNVICDLGNQGLDQLLAGVERGILVTGFLGGNANPATGDFSFGISGYLIEGGRRGAPISEMNIADNHLELWQRLSAVGNDPYLYSSWRIPSLVIEKVQFSGK